MTSRPLDLKDFAIAARQRTDRQVQAPDPRSEQEVDQHRSNSVLPKTSESERRRLAESRADAQQSVRDSLKNLKRSKERSIKFYVNIALDYDMKRRLQRSAMENDVKMTTVVKAALDHFLRQNGY